MATPTPMGYEEIVKFVEADLGKISDREYFAELEIRHQDVGDHSKDPQ